MMDFPGTDKLLTELNSTRLFTQEVLEKKVFFMYRSICVLPNICEKLTKRFLSQN